MKISFEDIRKNCVLYRTENNCELYRRNGTWNEYAKKPDYVWYMLSEKTGIHSIITQSGTPDERVNLHFAGFVANQRR